MKKGETLKKYTRDLTEQARLGSLDPVIGRADEINRAIQVLSRRTKNNPVFIGEAGVGKTAIVEGMAQRIIANEVPDSVKDKRLLALDLSALVAGTSFRGQFEERFKNLLSDAMEESDKIILFADEIHQIVGMGSTQGGDGGMDAANILKPMLARGEIRFIGATTLDEYRKHIEKDQALTRRFQPVFVNEPTVEETIAILRGLKERYEVHHGVRISDTAVVAAAQYAHRYITERKMPDKAIDLLDEATSWLRMRSESKPDDLARVERELLTLRIENEALKKETDKKSADRLRKVESTVKSKQKEYDELHSHWIQYQESKKSLQSLREKLETAKIDLEKAQRTGNFSLAGELKYGTIPKLQADLDRLSGAADAQQDEVVREDHVAMVISNMTGIPVTRLLSNERQRLLEMESLLKKRVIGQDHALKAISDCIRVSRTGLHAHDKPIGTFLFLGPTGVGKTELAKSLAEFMFDDPNAIVRIDMSEFGLQHSVARLIGAPPGYIGYGEGGTLTEPVRRRPYQVVLLDEVEKAHRDVTNILLQVMDEGRLTDSNGRKVDFRNTIVILTSNLGSDLLSTRAHAETVSDYDKDLSVAMTAVRSHFAPEFINRLDSCVLFNHLTLENMVPIAHTQLQRIKSMLYDDRRIELVIEGEAVNLIANEGFDPSYGARPLKRSIQNLLLYPLSRFLLSGEVEDGGRVIVRTDPEKKELSFSFSKPLGGELKAVE